MLVLYLGHVSDQLLSNNIFPCSTSTCPISRDNCMHIFALQSKQLSRLNDDAVHYEFYIDKTFYLLFFSTSTSSTTLSICVFKPNISRTLMLFFQLIFSNIYNFCYCGKRKMMLFLRKLQLHQYCNCCKMLQYCHWHLARGYLVVALSKDTIMIFMINFFYYRSSFYARMWK